ncbi:MAG: OmcA/MtrC family decaheme c-type cytochrome [Thermoanaerobaculia bacterium]
MSSVTRGLVVIAATAALSFAAVAHATNTSSSHRRGTAVSAATAPTAPSLVNFTSAQLEYYLGDDGIAYVRPGLKIKVNSVTVGSDRKPVVDLNITDNFDQPLDRQGKVTPGPVSISFIGATWDPAARHYTAYTTRKATSDPSSPNPGVTVDQAGTDSGGTWTDLEMGHATYKFKTAIPAGVDPSTTQTIGLYATRNLTDIVGKNYYSNVEYDFRGDGAKVTETWDKINTATACNACHDPLAMHGGSRQDVKLCAMCHNPQTIDPDTGNTVDLKVMIHKIHRGENLPSVQAGQPYEIIGHNNSVNDYSEVAFPQDIRNCANCHSGRDPKAVPSQANVWYTDPSRAACGSCHDNINWETGANHAGGSQANDAACAQCHVPDSGAEFDASIKAAHTVPEKSKQLAGINAQVVSFSNMTPGSKPTVVFKITNDDGSAVDATKLDTFAPMIGGPTSSYTYNDREDARKTGTFDSATGNTTYTFSKAIPADASGTWVITADTYRFVNLKRADGKDDIQVRECAMNPIQYVALTGTLTPRRKIVDINNCNSCHDRLALHGGQRLTTEECVICHNPTADDSSQRPADAGAPESISFQRMIHRIHSGENLTQNFTVYGYHGSVNNYNGVLFPGDRKDCAKCHVSGSQNIPVATGADPVTTLRDYFSPQGPATAACLGCHDNRDAAAHAYLMTAQFPGSDTPAEACATCHSSGKDWAVDKVHAR